MQADKHSELLDYFCFDNFGVTGLRCLRSVLLGTLALVLGSTAGLAEKRVALVIGNSDYQNVARLANPANDAAAMAAIFKKAKFDEVELRNDLSATAMRRALRDFADKARDADIAVVYYAGHGIEVDGNNYLIPIDAQLDRDTDVYDETFALDRILVAVEPAKQLRLVILDACRDNPFSKTMKRTVGSRAIGRGLAKVEPSSPNTMIAFAAKAGFTASDGESKNSPFAAALVKHLATPGLDLRKAFGYVRDDVLKVTNNKQEPFVYGSLGGNDVALVPAVAIAAPPTATAPAANTDANSAIRRDYELAERVGTREAWDFFIATYPDGFYAKLAQAQRNKMTAEEARLKATEKARVAQDEQTRLAIEGAKAAEQTKAAAQARAAEEARVAAEKKKALEDTRVAEAEKIKAAAQAKAAEDARIAEVKVKAAEQKLAEQKSKDDTKADNRQIGPIASLTPPDQAGQTAPKLEPATAVAGADIPRLLQTELRRVGCNVGAVDGNWNAAAQKSMALFNQSAGTKLDVKVASLDALDVVKSKSARICPLICDHGFKADGERCVKVTCKAGFEVGDDNTCERIEVKKPVAKRDSGKGTADKPAEKPKSSGEGQYVCGPGGCRAVAKGCRLERRPGYQGMMYNAEVCG